MKRALLFLIMWAYLLPKLEAQQSSPLPSLPEGQVTVHALAEDMSPLVDVKVTLAFEEPHPKWGSAKEHAVVGFTDGGGSFSGSGPCPMEIGGKAELSGYYLSFLPMYQFKDVKEGKCQPWNPTVEVILKRIIKPVPMYAKKFRGVLPSLDQPIGFDLAASDWVKPFGKGIYSDFIFTLSHGLKDSNDFTATLLVTFTNKGDGIQSIPQSMDRGLSVLKLPRNAPIEGYTSAWSSVLNHGSFGSIAFQSQSRGYFFRVRSSMQENKVAQAKYGKIDGPISIVGAATEHPGIAFIYYFNPAGNTNLEFDPNRNLLNNLNDDDEVMAP